MSGFKYHPGQRYTSNINAQGFKNISGSSCFPNVNGLKGNVIRTLQSVANFWATGALPASVFLFLGTRSLGQRRPAAAVARMRQPPMINSSAKKGPTEQGLGRFLAMAMRGWGRRGATPPFPRCCPLAGRCLCHQDARLPSCSQDCGEALLQYGQRGIWKHPAESWETLEALASPEGSQKGGWEGHMLGTPQRQTCPPLDGHLHTVPRTSMYVQPGSFSITLAATGPA